MTTHDSPTQLALLRFLVLHQMVFVADECPDIWWSRDTVLQSGACSDLHAPIGDVMLAARELVGIGHAEMAGGCYTPTQAGRDWLAAEMAVRQSSADAHERVAQGVQP